MKEGKIGFVRSLTKGHPTALKIYSIDLDQKKN